MVHVVEVSKECRRCPVCDSENFEPIYEYQVTKPILDAHWVFDVREGICINCGTIYTNPCPTNKMLEQYYKSKFLFVMSSEPDYDVEARLKYIQRHTHCGADVLEIGAGDGQFVSVLKSIGFRAVAIEPNQRADYVDAVDIVSFDQDIKNRKFDLVLLNHVLEHIFDPLSFLRSIRKFLKDKGSLIIEVPNLHLYGRTSTGISHEHITHFSPSTLKRLLQRSGYFSMDIDHTLVSREEGFVIRAQSDVCSEKISDTEAETFHSEYFVNRGYYIAGKCLHSSRSAEANIHASKLLSEYGSKNLALWGANDIAVDVLNSLSKDEQLRIRVVDSNQVRWGTKFSPNYSINVENPEILKKDVDSWLVCVAAIDWYKEIRDTAISYGIREGSITKIPIK